MYKIGITGSIGTGKTTLTKNFAIFKIPIFNADKEIKKILSTEKVKKRIKKIWPQAKKKNDIDRLILRKIIFSNKNEKKKLENLLYPYLKIERSKFEEKNSNKRILVYDVPLIYETNSAKNYDLVLLVNCDPTVQKKRVLKRDKISNSLYEKIIESQLTFSEKKKYKPKVINTNNLKFFIFIKIVLLLISILITLSIKNGRKKKINT